MLALGINHNTASIAVRDRLAFGPEGLPLALHEMLAEGGLSEAAILSTCNRVELYGFGEPGDAERVIQWLHRNRHMPLEDLKRCLYVHSGNEAVRHVMRVACGLDSMVLGEPQILGQMKDAHAAAQAAGTLGQQLAKVFQQTFAVAKQVRTETAIGQSAVSVAYAAVQLAKRIFADLSQTTVLFIGAGETVQLAAQHLVQQGAQKIIVANRTLTRAIELAQLYHGEAIALAELPDHLARADIVISSTASPLPILGKGLIERAIKQRKHKPVFMVDLAVPRDIEPEAAELDDVYLYSVDDLKNVVQENLKARQEAAQQAEQIISTQVDAFFEWQRARDAASTIRDLREHWQHLQQQELERALGRLRAGENAEDVLQHFAHRLGNKFLHAPSERLRRAAAHGDHGAIEHLRGLFDLDAS